MPFYSYRCGNCHADFDVLRSFKDQKDAEHCPECGLLAPSRVATPGVARIDRGGTGASRRAT